MKKWRNQLEVEQDVSFTQLIHNFYDILLSNWHMQYKWFNQVFPHQAASDTLLEIYTDTIASLDPSLNECIDAALKQVSDKLSFLHEIKQTMKQFAKNLLNVIESSMQGKMNQDKYTPMLQVIFSPFAVYIGKYAAYEQAYLIQKLSTISFIKEELPDTIQALGLTIPLVIDVAREAKQRCELITENCGYCGLLVALRAFFLSYVDQYRVALRQISRLKLKEEDWTTFQLCLSLLQNVGDVLMNLQQLEKDLTSSVLDFNKSSNVLEYKNLFLNPAERKELESLIKCVSDGTRLSLLDHVSSEFNKLCSDIHHTTYQVVFAPISKQLDVVQSTKVWAQISESNFNSDLPDYSFSPQEYITQVCCIFINLIFYILSTAWYSTDASYLRRRKFSELT